MKRKIFKVWDNSHKRYGAPKIHQELLKKGNKTLTNGMPAYEAIFRWYPSEDLRIYQHQIFVLHKNNGYKLTTSFTKKTRKILGPQVERIMLSFNPI